MGSIRAAQFFDPAPPRLHKDAQNPNLRVSATSPSDGPQRRCSIHDPRTCPFSAGDGAETEHRKGPRPVICEINSRFRRFGPRKVHPAPLGRALAPTRRSVCSGGSAIPLPHDLVDTGLIPEPATSSACIITMDHDAIICFMTDRLARGPDKDVHVPRVGSQKYPSRGVDVIYL